MNYTSLGLAVLLVIGWINRNSWLMPVLRWCWRRWRCFWRWLRSEPMAAQALQSLEATAGRLELTLLRVEAVEQSHSAAIVITDAKGQLVWANAAFLTLTGLTLDRVLGGNWLNAVHQQDREELRASWKLAVQERRDFDHCYRYWSFARGQEQWAHAHVRVGFNPLSGEVVGWVATVVPVEGPPLPAVECPAGHWVPPIS